MAGDWIKMRVNLVTDPAVKSIARGLRLDPFSVVGRLHAFWAWADEHTQDGAMKLATQEDIDDIAGKRGFAAQLEAVGWLKVDVSGFTLPNFERHNGESAKRRVMETEKKRRQRNGAQEQVNVPENQGQHRDNVGTEAGPEKRREEKSNTIPPAPAAPADPRHHEICQKWGPLFKASFGVEYRFDPKDAATLKRFLKHTQESPTEFLAVASSAWERTKQNGFAKRCKDAATIHGLCTYYNDVRVELAQGVKKAGASTGEFSNAF